MASEQKLSTEIQIIYEDEYVMSLNKPAGMLVHSDGRTDKKTVADWIGENYPDLATVGEVEILPSGIKIMRPGIVHRLDKETSGVLLVAKTQNFFYFLKNQFQKRLVQKTYNAFVYGSPSPRRGIIESKIGRSRSDFRKFSSKKPKGVLREAETHYKTLISSDKNSFLEVAPKTGRTHQIRVHLKSIGCPIICDNVYAPKRPPMLGFQRLALHAKIISFRLPNDCMLAIEAPLPHDFENALKEVITLPHTP